MSILGIVAAGVKKALGIVSEVVTDKDQRNELNHKMEALVVELGAQYEQELTKRHELDMKSDSWLSKNVRPLTLLFLLFVFVIISFFDGNIGQFSVDEAYIPVYQMLLSLVFTFYFGSRGMEKIMKIYKDKDTKE